jgi:hypothetical protein
MKNSFISPLNDYVVKCIYGDQKNIANTEGFLIQCYHKAA